MKLSFLTKCNVHNVAVTIAVLMPTMAVGRVITGDSDSSPANKDIPTSIMSTDAMKYWLTHTDAELNFIGDSINPLSSRSALITTVTYCSKRTGNVCGGACTVYTGLATCLDAPDTNCLVATNDVGFCDHGGCSGSCHDLSSCGTSLADGYCFTPGTASIVVSNL